MPIQRSPIQENFADTEIIPGLMAPKTQEMPAVPQEIPRPRPRGKHRGSGKSRVPNTPGPDRTAPSGALWGHLRGEAADTWGQMRETFTLQNWGRFFAVVIPVALLVAFSVNQVFGPRTGPLSNLRIVVPSSPTLKPTHSPVPSEPLSTARPAPGKAPVAPVKRTRTPSPTPTGTKPHSSSPKPSPSDSGPPRPTHSATDTSSPSTPATTPISSPTTKSPPSETPATTQSAKPDSPGPAPSGYPQVVSP